MPAHSIEDTQSSAPHKPMSGGRLQNPLEELTLGQLRQRTSMKWRTHPDDVLQMWVAEMDVRLAQPVASALHDAIETGDTGYPSATGYAQAVAGFAADRWAWHSLNIDATAIVPDVMMGIVEVLRLITEPGDAVVVCAPVYPPFYAFVTHDGRRIIEAPLTDTGRIDPGALDAALRTARAMCRRPVLLLCNPHNPTGAVHTRAELTVVAEITARHGARVISDEIHAPLVLPGATFTPYLDVPGSENAFALISGSKAWNVAGLKAALLIAGPDAVRDLRRLPEEVSHGPSHLGIIAQTAAFEHGRPWLDALLAGLDDNRRLIGELIPRHLPQIRYIPPEGTYLAWLDCRLLGLPAHIPGNNLGTVSDLSGPAQLFLNKARVALSSGHVFGTGGDGHVRLNFATSQAVLRETIERMGHAVLIKTA